jgi:hypothetical protein
MELTPIFDYLFTIYLLLSIEVEMLSKKKSKTQPSIIRPLRNISGKKAAY